MWREGLTVTEREMERVFSVEELSDPFWAPSPAWSGVGPAPWGTGELPDAMKRIPSEWLLEKFLEEASAPDIPSLPPIPTSSLSSVARLGEDDEVLEIKRPDPPPVATAEASPPLPAASQAEEYAAILKQKLNMYCAAVAMTRGSGVKPQDYSPLADSRMQSSETSQLGSQALVNGRGPNGVPAPPVMQNSTTLGKPATSGSSREQSDDDELEGETETTENMDLVDAKRERRMLSNRESARRSRRKKQAHLSDLELQVSQLRGENSSLSKRLMGINQKYNEAAVDNRILKADAETLRAKVKMAEDKVMRATGGTSTFPSMSDLASIIMPFSGNAAVPIQDELNHFFQAPVQDRMGQTAPMERGPDHLHKRI